MNRSIRHINNEWELTTTETLKSEGKISAWMVNVKSVHGEVSLPAPSAAENQTMCLRNPFSTIHLIQFLIFFSLLLNNYQS